MRSLSNGRLVARLLFAVGVLQPVSRADAFEAVRLLARNTDTPAEDAALASALNVLREERLVWAVQRQVFSLTAEGNAALRRLGLHRTRDKYRLLQLRAQAR